MTCRDESPAPALPRPGRLGYPAGVKSLTVVLALPFVVGGTVAAHALLARVLKAVLWSWSPLSDREPEAATYERRVYHLSLIHI